MSVLHIVNKSPYDRNSLDTCLRLARADSAILLIEDGIYATQKNAAASEKIARTIEFKSPEEIGKAIDVDSLHYLSLEKLHESVPQNNGIGYCDACFTGNYPIPVDTKTNKFAVPED